MSKNIPLTAAEISHLWTSYMNASLTKGVTTYFSNKVEDEEIEPIINKMLSMAEEALPKLTSLIQKDNHPLPNGFSLEEDINVSAPKLYTDNFMLEYVLNECALGMNYASTALSNSTREDVYSYYSDLLANFNELHRTAMNIALEKGIYVRPPVIPTPDKVDFTKKQSFLAGWFGNRRPLAAPEITNLYANIKRNALGAATLMGFSQVAESKEVKSFTLRGIEIARKHINIFSELLESSDVPVPMGSDSMVTASSEVSPFSDKLIMYHTAGMIVQGIGFYGNSISTNVRRDIATQYARLIGEIALFSEDGANIMIKNEWMEQPPRMINREELANNN
ncbi:Protein of unknown function [Oceanobacillus limi]|uniref:DUF3231 family protein n=1 Tax=Oceanobacillus limi TaxID=930131 RepID=A0A1I0E5E3_9BACI|nr:DUF3231 family protein [Oceanobacillus limi]SET40005.1 Protein of unknown function [Oceanobacillus limi]